MRRTSLEDRIAFIRLAEQIDQFAYESDPAEYLVSRRERKQCIEDIASDIADGNTDYLSEYIVGETSKRKYLVDFTNKHIADALNMVLKLTQFAKNKEVNS